MNEVRKRGIRRSWVAVWAVASGVCLLAAAWVLHAVSLGEAPDRLRPATRAEVASSLERGVAWIWPGSNGPVVANGQVSRYRDAAVLVESLVLRGQGVERGGRTQPLALPEGVRLLPVVHVEAAPDSPSMFTPAQRDLIVAATRRHADIALAGAGTLQLDFEAPARQRQAYRELVVAVRKALPSEVRLSVTALAHWCTQGDWLDQLPADEVVPMLYRLGPDAASWRRRFEADAGGLARSCRGPALGFATNDPPAASLLARVPRPYWFDETVWSNPSRPPSHLMP